MSFRTFCRQHFNYGRGAFRFYRAAGTRWPREIGVHGRFYLKLPALLRQALFGVPPRRLVQLLALLMVWQSANVAGVAWEAAHRW